MPPSLALSPRRRPPPIQTFPFPYLIFPAILLAIATFITLFIHSNLNTALLWSQCHSRSLLPFLTRHSHLPSFITTPLCFLASFFELALEARSAAAAFTVVLAFVGGLLTVHTVEAARVCNAPSVLIAWPTGPWLVFNLVGGAFVWELVIIPAFLHHGKRILDGKEQGTTSTDQEQGETTEVTTDESRHLPEAEVYAIPAAIAIGFYLPTILMLVLRSPVAVLVWLFFPVYVSLIRQTLRYGINRLIARNAEHRTRSIHLESSRWSLVAVYALPVLFSISAHIVMMWAAARGPGHGDRREETRSAIKFVEIDATYMALTVLYWMFVEVGWRVPLAALTSSTVVGPGAGLCLGWVYREWLIHRGAWAHEDEGEEEAGQQQDAGEETPLLG